MKRRFLLDCTLRDGGYINDWKFGHDNLVHIFERVVSAGVDVVEIGFLDDRRSFDINRSIMPGTADVEKIFGMLDRKDSMVVGMIDYGTCDIKNIQPCEQSFLDGIRVIFKKKNLYPAMEYCRKIKELGYKVFAQLVSITDYSDEELREAVRLANELEPYALSIVDTYGLLNPESLRHLISTMDEGLNRDITIGFHAHNNLQLGYSNATAALDYDTERAILVDGTLYGMGKSAGNAPLELVAMYMNDHCGKNYVITQMQEAITTSVMDFQKISPWGYQLFYYIAASNKVHPNYVSFLMNKRTLSITTINELLQKIPDDQKLEKNMGLIEKLYLEYQKRECADEKAISALQDELADKTVLIIGPGSGVGKYESKIREYIERIHPVIIAINYIPMKFHPDYLFLTNATRYLQTATKLLDSENADIRLIATSNLTKNERAFDYVINYSGVIDESAEFPDNSMCMLIRTLIRCGCGKVALAGLDGYTPDNVNYFDEEKAYSFLKEKAKSLNDYARKFFREIEIPVEYVTPSEYQKEA